MIPKEDAPVRLEDCLIFGLEMGEVKFQVIAILEQLGSVLHS
jgi:hypothetical protein